MVAVYVLSPMRTFTRARVDSGVLVLLSFTVFPPSYGKPKWDVCHTSPSRVHVHDVGLRPFSFRVSACRVSAIDSKRVAGHEACKRTAQPKNGSSDLLRSAKPPHRLVSHHLFHRERFLSDHVKRSCQQPLASRWFPGTRH